MKKLAVKQFDEKDEEFAEVLINLGMGRNTARTLAYLRSVNEAKAVDVERAAGLHQPDVSLAMKELKQFNWITVWEEKKPSRGRPHKIYSLRVSVNEIISKLENSMIETLEKQS